MYEIPQLDRLCEVMETGLTKLGLNDSDSNMGALENLALEVKTAGENIRAGLEDMAEAIRGHTRMGADPLLDELDDN